MYLCKEHFTVIDKENFVDNRSENEGNHFFNKLFSKCKPTKAYTHSTHLKKKVSKKQPIYCLFLRKITQSIM